MTALAVMQLLPQGAEIAGQIHLSDEDILAAGEDRMCALRGNDVGMVFQEPMTALNPVKTIGDQVAETTCCMAPWIAPPPWTVRGKCWRGSACPKTGSR